MHTRLAFLALISLLLAERNVTAKAILITRGDSISHLGSIEGKARPKGLPGNVNSVGFKYWCFGIFWLDLWRSDGTYCVYQGDNYQPISKAEAAALLGVPEDDLGTPFFYRFPPGLIVVGVFVAFGIAGAITSSIKKKKVMELVNDPRYQQALDRFTENVRLNEEAKQAATEKNEPPPESPIDPWESAITELVAAGIERAEAEEKFGKVLAYAMQRADERAAKEKGD